MKSMSRLLCAPSRRVAVTLRLWRRHEPDAHTRGARPRISSIVALHQGPKPVAESPLAGGRARPVAAVRFDLRSALLPCFDEPGTSVREPDRRVSACRPG